VTAVLAAAFICTGADCWISMGSGDGCYYKEWGENKWVDGWMSDC